MLIKLRFNKPAVETFFIDEQSKRRASHIGWEVTGDVFSLYPLWVEEVRQRGYLLLTYSERGSASTEMTGSIADASLRALRNIYNNPFFELQDDGFGKIETKPYMPTSIGRVSSPRFEPIMRVFETQDGSFDLPARTSTLDIDLALQRVMHAHDAIKQKHKTDISQDEIEDAHAILAKFEAVARSILPIFSDVERLVLKYGTPAKKPKAP